MKLFICILLLSALCGFQAFILKYDTDVDKHRDYIVDLLNVSSYHLIEIDDELDAKEDLVRVHSAAIKIYKKGCERDLALASTLGGGGTGAGIGAAAGAVAGSVVPVVGTAVGALLGNFLYTETMILIRVFEQHCLPIRNEVQPNMFTVILKHTHIHFRCCNWIFRRYGSWYWNHNLNKRSNLCGTSFKLSFKCGFENNR